MEIGEPEEEPFIEILPVELPDPDELPDLLPEPEPALVPVRA